MLDLLLLAAKIALPKDPNDARNFWLGCVGLRDDGALVSAQNGSSQFSHSVKQYQLQPNCHAEGRVLRKLGKYGTMFVSRVAKKDGALAMAQPCIMCQVRISAMKIRKVYFTINPTQYGIWSVNKDVYKIINC